MTELSEFKPGFGSDNHSGVHPEIWDAIARVNHGHAPSYETDVVSTRAQAVLASHFGKEAQSFFVFNGTAANVLSLRPLVESFHAILCAATSHLHVDECGAPEKFLGCKLIAVPTRNGKLTIDALQSYLIRRGDQHFSQPRVLSITQPTELGTLYTLAEISTLVRFAHEHGLYVHVDGARLVNAAAALNCSLNHMTTDLGIDALSLGGTKNGLMFGEAVVFFRKELAENFKYHRKQAMQLPSKTRFIAAQFEAWLGTDLWLRSARHANAMATRLAQGLREFRFVEITQDVQCNAVFARLPRSLVAPLREHYFFYVWDEHQFEVRLMTSFDTQAADIDGFLRKLKELGTQLEG